MRHHGDASHGNELGEFLYACRAAIDPHRAGFERDGPTTHERDGHATGRRDGPTTKSDRRPR
ncbi:hypothetical protein ACIBBB_06590 [Streptomyces sp. NPDC051217]|uniref:hypothetical protein n=1 Tax=Streptomyces sp. NPDC051217 TaxID=3365644 RepID=UPI0037A0CBF1